jgi:MFS family permease
MTIPQELRAWLRTLASYDRNVYLMLLFTLGKGLQLSILSLAFTLYAHSLGFDDTFVGILAGVPAVGSLVASVPTGLLADRIGRKPLVLLGSVLNPLAIVLIGLSTSAPALLFGCILNGVCSNAYWVTNLPILTESTRDEERVGVFALNNFLLLGVGALGSVIGGAIPEFAGHIVHAAPLSTVPLRWSLLVAALVTFLPTPALLWLSESRRVDKALPGIPHTSAIGDTPGPEGALVESETAVTLATAGREGAGGGDASDPPSRVAVVRLFAKLLLPVVLYTTGEGCALALLPLYFALHFGLPPGPLGVFLSLAGLAGGLTSFAAPRLVRRWGKLRTATSSQYGTIPIVLTIGFAPLFGVAAVAEVARNVLRGVFEPTYAAFTMERVSSRYRATLSGLYSVTWSIGFSLGATVAGWLFQHVSYSSAFLASAVLILFAATLLRLWFGGKMSGGERPGQPEPHVAETGLGGS